MGRAPCCDKANVKKGPWSPEEDSKLKEYIDKYGTGGNWIALPQKAGLKRCGKSCRLRWLNYLRPNIKHGEFSDEEDRIICSLFASIGSRWSIIAAQLPGRTDNDIKNYWNTKLKKKLMGLHMAPPPPLSHRNLLKPPPFPPYSAHQIRPSVYNRSFSSSGFEFLPHVSMASSNHYFSNPTSNSSSLFPTENASPYAFAFEKNSNNNSNNLLMFGSTEGSCSTSSDGSCNQIKKEELGFDQSFNQSTNIPINCFDHDQDQKNQGFMMVNYGGTSEHQVFDQWSERVPNGFCFGADNTLEFSDRLEDVKQLSIKSNSLLFNGDENKAAEEKVMYFY